MAVKEARKSSALRIGILGAGHMGAVHAQSLAAVPRARIVAVCSQPLETAEALSHTINGSRPFADFDEMLAASRLDALYICLPPFAHAGQFEMAAAQGVHVFIEKPIALAVRRAQSMSAAARRARIVTQVGYHMRFGKAVRALKRMIDDGTAGMPTLFDGRYECNALHASWWRDRARSGGQVFEQVIHLYDLALYLLGTPRIVAGFTTNLCHRKVHGYTAEDTSVGMIRFASGALGTIAGTNCAVPQQWNATFTVVCEKLTAHFRNHNDATIIFTAGKRRRQIEVAADVDAYVEEDKAFVDSVLTRGPGTATIDEGLCGLRMVAGVVASSRRGGAPVRIPSSAANG